MDGMPTLDGTGRCDAVESVLIRNRSKVPFADRLVLVGGWVEIRNGNPALNDLNTAGKSLGRKRILCVANC